MSASPTGRGSPEVDALPTPGLDASASSGRAFGADEARAAARKRKDQEPDEVQNALADEVRAFLDNGAKLFEQHPLILSFRSHGEVHILGGDFPSLPEPSFKGRSGGEIGRGRSSPQSSAMNVLLPD